ncbi:hypothetical protein C8F01DRAFT_1378658 [Mycena amicta]|nr:hypothetical protein C8F01DRAFT_1378658 [Mycena amicta]
MTSSVQTRYTTAFHTDEYVNSLNRDGGGAYPWRSVIPCWRAPAFESLFEYRSVSPGGPITAAQRLTSGGTDIAINWAGGLHHATSPPLLRLQKRRETAFPVLVPVPAHRIFLSTRRYRFAGSSGGGRRVWGKLELADTLGGYATRAGSGSGAILLSDPPAKLAFDPSTLSTPLSIHPRRPS